MKSTVYNGYKIVDTGYGFAIEKGFDTIAEFDSMGEAQLYIDSLIDYDKEASAEIPEEFVDTNIDEINEQTGLRFVPYGNHLYRETSGKHFEIIKSKIKKFNKNNGTNIFCYDDPQKFCTFIKF